MPAVIMLVMPLRLPGRHNVLRAERTSAFRVSDFLRVVIVTRVEQGGFGACLAESLRGSGTTEGTWFVVLWTPVGLECLGLVVFVLLA